VKFCHSRWMWRAQLYRWNPLNIPLLSAAMDTSLRRGWQQPGAQGGLGICTAISHPKPRQKRWKLSNVRNRELISDPGTLPPTATLGEAGTIMRQFTISGFLRGSMDAQAGWHLTTAIIAFCGPDDHSRPVSEFMTQENWSLHRPTLR
jgi:IMP dehydrogenase